MILRWYVEIWDVQIIQQYQIRYHRPPRSIRSLSRISDLCGGTFPFQYCSNLPVTAFETA